MARAYAKRLGADLTVIDKRRPSQNVAEVMNIEAVLIFGLNQANRELELLAHRGVSNEFALSMNKTKVGEGVCGKVAASGEPMLVQDACQDPALSRPEALKEGLCAHLVVPLWFKGAVIGTLCVASRRPRQFQPQEIDLLTAIGGPIAVALVNARLYERQKQLATEVEISEKNYRTIFESANDAIWVHDMDGHITAANRATSKLTGYAFEDLARMNVKTLMTENGLKLAREIRVELLRGEAVEHYEQQLTRRDGSTAIMQLTTNLIASEGRPTGFQHVARDVTDEKRMQENLRYYIQQAVRVQEEERRRIARELHDDTAQILGSISRQLDNFIRKKRNLSATDESFLKDLNTQVSRGLQGVHRFSQNLRPSILDDLGLLPALRSMLNEAKERDGLNTALEVHGAQRRFSSDVELLVFRIAQEAISNIVKHALASKAQVGIDFGEGTTRLTISDNGSGFELTGRLDDLPRSGKLGLAGMQERARLLGGSLEIRSSRGKGTEVTVAIPG